MFWLNLRRVFQAGFLNFWRTPVVSAASVIALAVALFVIGLLILGAVFMRGTLDDLKEKVDISVSFKPDAPVSEVLSLKQSLEGLPGVVSAIYRSREDELEEFRQRNLDNELVLRSLEEVGNPFGARLNVQAADPTYYEGVAAFLEKEPALAAGGETLIDRVSFQKDIVDRLINLVATSRKIGLAAAAVLIFISLVVTFNTISLAIYVAREEISLMKLVGASDHYIRGPFIVEGIIAGTVAAFLALALLYPSAIWLRDTTMGLYGGINLVSYFVSNLAQLFLILVATGILLGIAASFLATRKHLRSQ